MLYTNATLLLLFCSVWQRFTIKSHDCCSRRCCCCRCFCSELLMKWKNACETKKNSKNQEQTSLTTTTTTTLGTVSAKCLYTHTYLNSVNIWRTDCPTEKSCKSGREEGGWEKPLGDASLIQRVWIDPNSLTLQCTLPHTLPYRRTLYELEHGRARGQRQQQRSMDCAPKCRDRDRATVHTAARYANEA